MISLSPSLIFSVLLPVYLELILQLEESQWFPRVYCFHHQSQNRKCINVVILFSIHYNWRTRLILSSTSIWIIKMHIIYWGFQNLMDSFYKCSLYTPLSVKTWNPNTSSRMLKYYLNQLLHNSLTEFGFHILLRLFQNNTLQYLQ